MKKLERIFSMILALSLLLTTIPGATATASPSIIYEADDALLLMLASHNIMSSGGLASANPKMASVSPQAGANEVDILLDIYAKQLHELDLQGHSDEVKLRLVAELDKKLKALESKAQLLEAERQNRRRRGLFRNISRALGRATGWVMSRAMEGTGKIVQYSIEEVGPQLLKDAVFSGTPLTGAAFRAKFREMLRNRVRAVINRKIDTRLAALASEHSPDPNPTQPAFEPAQEPEQNQPVPQPTESVQGSTDELSLTPEEELNQGTHTYREEGHSNMLGQDTHLSGEKTVTLEFTPEGVLASFDGSPANLYLRTDTNTFVFNDSTLIMTSDGFEFHFVSVYEVHADYTIIN